MIHAYPKRRVSMVRRVLDVLAAVIVMIALVLVGILIWFIASYWVAYNAANSRYDATDVRPLRSIVARALPIGSTVDRARHGAVAGDRDPDRGAWLRAIET